VTKEGESGTWGLYKKCIIHIDEYFQIGAMKI
jgi:hypothetical protein